MEKLYSVKDIQKLFGFKAGRIRYWDRIGFLTPSVRFGTRKYYISQDLIGLRTARGLFDAGLSFPQVRRSVIDLKRTPFGAAKPHSLPFIVPQWKEMVLDRDTARSNLGRRCLIGFSRGDFERGIKSASMQFKADVKPQGHASRRPRQTHWGRQGPVKFKTH